MINAAVSDMSAAPAVADARDATSTAIDEAAALGPRLTREASEKIRAATKVEDGWSMLKRGGTSVLPHGDPTAAAQRLLEGLQEVGLFVVSVGELEGWHPGVPQKSSAWLDTVLTKELYTEPGRHHEFMATVDAWFTGANA